MSSTKINPDDVFKALDLESIHRPAIDTLVEIVNNASQIHIDYVNGLVDAINNPLKEGESREQLRSILKRVIGYTEHTYVIR